ncbi:MAG: hypothetical protein C3F07_10965 [Anaerolineales bacterium]|nr:MAG: hypothetical protein C3F07_10965 [Anaerolineales bacterium]
MSLPEPIPPSRRALLIHLFRRIVKPVTRERRAEVQIQLRDSSDPDFDFFLLVVLSSVIATLGLLTDSPAVIIGAMLVAPLMSPIIGLGLASLTGDATLFRNAGIALARGAISSIVIATFLTYANRLLPFLPLQELPAEVLARTHPSPIDLTIALAGGMAAAFALAMPSISAALPGVAIATALMPPLCTVGIGIAMGRWDLAGGALLLFITNAVTIAFAAMLVFSALGFTVRREDGHIVPRALTVAAFSTLILFIPLTWISVRFFHQATENRLIEDAIQAEIAPFDADLANIDITRLDNTIHITLTIRTSEPFRYQDVIKMQEAIALRLQKPVALVVNQIFAARLDPLIPPTLTITPTFTTTPTPVTLTPTPSYTPTSTPTITPSRTPVPPTPTATPSMARVTNTNGRSLDLVQSPGGPSIGKLRNGDYITVLYGNEVLDGLVWLQVMDKDGRIGWIPQINLSVVTLTPTVTATP